MSPRRDIPDHHRALKAMFRVLIGKCGGLDASAAVVRVGRSQLANYTDMHSDQFAPADVVADLEAVAGEPWVTSELARRGGFILLPAVPEGDGVLAKDMAALCREFSEACGAYADAMSNDGQVDMAEAERIARELGDVVRIASGALAHLRKARG